MNLVDKAQHEIKQMILERKYNEEGYLPSEGKLCELLSVSRSTIREAIKSLEIRGFVQRKHGKGILVVDKTSETFSRSMNDMFVSMAITLEEILEMRRMIEIPSAGLAATRAKSQNIEKMEKFVVELEKYQEINSDYTNADLNFHLALVEASNNVGLIALTRAYTPIIKKLIEKATENVPNEIERNKHYHRDILEAIKKKDNKKAEKTMEQHLKATASNSQLD